MKTTECQLLRRSHTQLPRHVERYFTDDFPFPTLPMQKKNSLSRWTKISHDLIWFDYVETLILVSRQGSDFFFFINKL